MRKPIKIEITLEPTEYGDHGMITIRDDDARVSASRMLGRDLLYEQVETEVMNIMRRHVNKLSENMKRLRTLQLDKERLQL